MSDQRTLADQENPEDGVSYWKLDPKGKKSPKRITERQFWRDQHFITFIRPEQEALQ